MNCVLGGARIFQGEGQFWVHLPAHCKVHGISSKGQSYLQGGSSDVAFRYQYCSNLFIKIQTMASAEREHLLTL